MNIRCMCMGLDRNIDTFTLIPILMQKGDFMKLSPSSGGRAGGWRGPGIKTSPNGDIFHIGMSNSFSRHTSQHWEGLRSHVPGRRCLDALLNQPVLGDDSVKFPPTDDSQPLGKVNSKTV